MNRNRERGATIVEGALSLLLLVYLLAGVFDFGRAYHVYQISTNAAREGARFSVAPSQGTTSLPSDEDVIARVREYLDLGALSVPAGNIVVTQNNTMTVSNVQMKFTTVEVVTPFTYEFLPFGTIQIHTRATMRNETN